MSDTCLNCGGLIMQQNSTYGYSGPICYCPVNPAHQYRRPASREMDKSMKDAITRTCKNMGKQYDYDRLEAENKRLREEILKASASLDAIKYELNSSVYTLEDDEFETIFFVRDCLDLALKPQAGGGNDSQVSD